MKYSILGFNQERVLSLTKEVKDVKKNKTTTISIDVDDLLILSVIADISNRKSIRKYSYALITNVSKRIGNVIGLKFKNKFADNNVTTILSAYIIAQHL